MKSLPLTPFFFFIIIIVACNKSDNKEAQQSETVKSLAHHSPLNFGSPTQVYLNKSSTPIEVARYGFDREEGILFVEATLKNKDHVSLSTSNQNVDGKIVSARISDKQYHGTNLNTQIKNAEEIEISGDLIEVGNPENKFYITVHFNPKDLSKGTSTFKIKGTTAELNGTLGGGTYNQVLTLNKDNPEVHTLLLEDVPGSRNDDVNVETGRLIREAGYTTKVPSYGKIYSGGVDLFCSGKKRLVKSGGIIGVHSWCCGTKGEDAKDIPENDGQHDKQISYFKEMLGDPIGREFYFFTINSAGYKGNHNMTQEEIKKYGLIKE